MFLLKAMGKYESKTERWLTCTAVESGDRERCITEDVEVLD
jgi:hypothetical protein